MKTVNAKIQKRSNKKSYPPVAQLSEQTFALFMERFDRIDSDNKAIVESIIKHVEEDKSVYAVVGKHSTYWSLALWISGSVGVGAIALLFSFLH